MKYLWTGAAFLALFAATLTPRVFAVPDAPQSELVIADFDSGDKPNNLGGDFGSWNKDAKDDSQGAFMTFVADDSLANEAGHSVRLDYDVDSENPAYNGFWMKLNDADFSPYDTLNFYVRGDEKAGYTKRLKIELKDASGTAHSYVMTGISDKWQKISISFKEFGKADWSKMSEFVAVFDDVNSRPKSGSIYIDQVTASKG